MATEETRIDKDTNMEDAYILVKGARANNLKNIDIAIPRDKFVVITGLSGGGKSSLAFDTLYAEGQRRYVESLSSYARQFLGRMNKPECDYIKGLPPAIAIEQKVSVRNPRSTVGTSTEIYDYLRLLFARVGKTISPKSGSEVRKHRVSDVVAKALSYPQNTRLALYSPLVVPEKRTTKEQLQIFMKEGFSRLEINNELYRIQDILDDENLLESGTIELLMDRMTVSDDKMMENRLADSVETAFFEGHGVCILKVYVEKAPQVFTFSKTFEADGVVFEEPSEMMFNFNNPLGACPVCEGFGKVLGIDESLVVPDKSLSVYDEAVLCWRGEVMGEWLRDFVEHSAKYGFPIHRAYYDLTDEERDFLWCGAEGVKGINDFFEYIESNQYKIQYRVMLSRYRGKTTCPACKGGRLKQAALYVLVGGRNIYELVSLPANELKAFFDGLELSETDALIAKRLLLEINSRLQFLLDVGLGYLTLDRLSSTLSGGEGQRISLAASLGSGLVGALYVLDEPSIGLHSRDTEMLIGVLKHLKDMGNTVVVVEHDEDIIRAADYIIDIGPDAGRLGGEIVYKGAVSDLRKESNSHTVRYLTGEDRIEVPPYPRPWNQYIEIKGARLHNLKKVDVKFPLHAMTVVTGVSGSGKSSLVRGILYEGVRGILNEAISSVECAAIGGDTHLLKAIEFVDQKSISRSTRSNPATYVGAYDEIRKMFAALPMAKRMKYAPSHFSFNRDGGRCEECKGDGQVVVSMQFLSDIVLTCHVCKGKRFKADILDVEYHGVSIYDMLEMTVDEVLAFLEGKTDLYTKGVIKKLKPLQRVGLGYIKLGQPSSTLSGGENQRVKLAYFLGQEKQGNTLFIFDEPTTGLHFHDIGTLIKAFYALIGKGHTVVIIEHHLDVIKCADYIVDLGVEGGEAGGQIVCAGTTKDIVACKNSYTGKFLQLKIEN